MVLITPALWEKAMAIVRHKVGDAQWTSWLASVSLEDCDEEAGTVTIAVPSETHRRWIQKRWIGEFSEALGAVMQRPVSVELHVDAPAAPPEAPAPQRRLLVAPDPSLEPPAGSPRLSEEQRLDRLMAAVTAPSTPVPVPGNGARRPAPRPARPAAPVCEPPRLNSRYLFEEFVVGESNRYAHAAAEAVANGTVHEYNPLFIYGGSGLGKTHLMQAIGHRLYAKDNSLRVTYVTSEEFINGFIAAIQNRKPIDFRNQFRNVDLLLLDDVQFLMGKERTQQEFFHTFNALHDAGKRIVMTSDRPPKELTTLEERLRTRFEWGLLVDIQPPDLETRIAILRKKVEVEGISLDSKVITFIAERLKDNIREMEGAVKRLKMASSLHECAIDLERARDILSHLMVGSPQPRVSVEDVQKTVCDYFGISMTDLLGSNRSKKFSQPRHLAQYLARKLTGFSFPDIAQKFGGKDHTSIIYACRKVEQSIGQDQNMANIASYLERQVTKGVD